MLKPRCHAASHTQLLVAQHSVLANKYSVSHGWPTPMGQRTVAGKCLGQSDLLYFPNGFPIGKKVSVHTIKVYICCHGNTFSGILTAFFSCDSFTSKFPRPGCPVWRPLGEARRWNKGCLQDSLWKNLVGRAGFPETQVSYQDCMLGSEKLLDVDLGLMYIGLNA